MADVQVEAVLGVHLGRSLVSHNEALHCARRWSGLSQECPVSQRRETVRAGWTLAYTQHRHVTLRLGIDGLSGRASCTRMKTMHAHARQPSHNAVRRSCRGVPHRMSDMSALKDWEWVRCGVASLRGVLRPLSWLGSYTRDRPRAIRLCSEGLLSWGFSLCCTTMHM